MTVAFHALFLAVLAFLVLLARLTDSAGYAQARSAILHQAGYSASLFAQALRQSGSDETAGELAVFGARAGLRPQPIGSRTPVSVYDIADFPSINSACYVRYASADHESFDICAGLPNVDVTGGLYLYVLARFVAPVITPHSSGPINGDFFAVDLLRPDMPPQRTIVAVRSPGERARRAALGGLDGDAGDDLADSFFELDGYRPLPGSTDQWATQAKPEPRNRVSGSLIWDSANPQERRLVFRVDLNSLRRPGERALTGAAVRNKLRDDLLIRFAYYRRQSTGDEPALVFATFFEGPDGTQDAAPVPRNLPYPTPGFGERLVLREDSRDGRIVWSCQLPQQQSREIPGTVAATPNCNSETKPAPGPMCDSFRCRWLDTAPMLWPSGSAPPDADRIETSDGRVFYLSSVVPADVAVATWNRFAPRLALSFAAVFGLVCLLYLLVMRAVLHRVQRLARTADNVGPESGEPLPFLHSRDEVGVLSRAFAGLVDRIRQDNEQRKERIKQEDQRLRAIAHHIRSSVQALFALNPPESRGHPYVDRIQRTVNALYGSETLPGGLGILMGPTQRVDLRQFVQEVANNSPLIGIADLQVVVDATQSPVVDVDSESLGDVVTQILNNANRFRVPGSAIRMHLRCDDQWTATLTIENSGPRIPDDMLDRIFDFGVSLDPAHNQGSQGQGLFVARELVSRMGGSIRARNLQGGVAFEIALPLTS